MMMSPQTTPKANRRFGYFLSIVINGAIYYVINTLPIWETIPFLTERFQDVLWITNLSIGVTAFMYATFLVFDPRWYHSLMQAVVNCFTFFTIRVFRQVFPLDLPDSTAYWVNIGLLILMVMMLLSAFTELTTAVRLYRKSNHE
jgi:hypothetical protein